MTTFRAAVLRGPDRFGVEELTLLPLGDAQVLVRVAACEFSVTDSMFAGKQLAEASAATLPQTLGHAMTGTVEAVGSLVRRVKVGDRVVANGTPYCGECWACLHGNPSQCSRMLPFTPPYARTADGLDVRGMGHVGGLAELAVLQEPQIAVVNGTTATDDDLAIIASSFGTAVGAALIIAPITPGSVVAAVGLGASGLSYIQAARFRGAHTIIGIDPIAERRERALSLGATHVIDSSAEDSVEAVKAITGGVGQEAVLGGADGYSSSGAEFVFEACADAVGMRNAFLMTRPAGHVIFSSLPHDAFGEVSIPAGELALYSRNAHGCQAGGVLVQRDFPLFARLIEDGYLNASLLHDVTGGLDDVLSIMQKCSDHEVVGASIHPNG